MSISRVHAASLSNLSRSSLVANRVTGQFEKDILKVGENRAEIRDPDAILGQTMNYLGDEIVTSAPNCELRVAADYTLDSRDGSKVLSSGSIVRGEDDGSLRAVPAHQVFRSVDVDDAPVFDDRYSVAQPFGLLHKMSGQENRLAAFADAPYQVPDGATGLRIQPSGQFVEKHYLRIVD